MRTNDPAPSPHDVTTESLGVYLDWLLDDIEAGNLPPVPPSLADLVARAAVAPPIVDVQAWAARLAAGLAEATEDG